MPLLKSAVHITHYYIKQIVKKGDTVIDATMGNGNDTAFLADLVGEQGFVYSFDIQEIALENTKNKLTEMGLAQRVSLIRDGHQNMDNYAQKGISSVMFNLGYLPGGDHKKATCAQNTITAINKALLLLKVGGIITIAVYYGGHTGFNEKEAVMEYIKSIDNKAFSVLVNYYINQPNCPPIAVCIEKINE